MLMKLALSERVLQVYQKRGDVDINKYEQQLNHIRYNLSLSITTFYTEIVEAPHLSTSGVNALATQTSIRIQALVTILYVYFTL